MSKLKTDIRASSIFVTAIGTDSGKTLVSSLLVEALRADYWKPIQSGLPRDTDTVRSLVSNTASFFHPERYLLQYPASPHDSAAREGVRISVADFALPTTTRPLVIEGAGGLLVPLNHDELMADLMEHLAVPVVLVSNLYLGSINHTLLTLSELKRRNIRLLGIVFNGDPNPASEEVILHHAQVPSLFRVPKLSVVDSASVAAMSKMVGLSINVV